nr:hypothetical protein [uncultured Tolumonas sp.]
MKKVIALSFALISFNTLAHMDCLVGNYKNDQGASEFTISGQHHEGTLTTPTGEKITVAMMKDKQISQLWKQMHWDRKSAGDAECAADSNKTHVVCELSNADAEPAFKHATNIYLKAGKELQLLKREDK